MTPNPLAFSTEAHKAALCFRCHRYQKYICLQLYGFIFTLRLRLSWVLFVNKSLKTFLVLSLLKTIQRPKIAHFSILCFCRQLLTTLTPQLAWMNSERNIIPQTEIKYQMLKGEEYLLFVYLKMILPLPYFSIFFL